MAIWKKSLPALFVAALSLGAVVVHADAHAAEPKSEAAAESQTPLTKMFVWWNAAYKDKNGFTPEAFAEHFTEDGAIVINGEERARGPQNLAERFRSIQARTEVVDMIVPFEVEFVSADGSKIFTSHIIKSRADGKDGLSRVMGYAVIENGKIKLVDFVSVDVTQ